MLITHLLKYFQAKHVKIIEHIMIIIGGPQQLKSKCRWAIRQILVYAVMPFRPLLIWLLNLTGPGY